MAKKKLEQLSLNFDAPTNRETKMHQKMAENIQYSERNDEHLKQVMNDKYIRFLSAVKSSGINVENIYANMSVKMNHLKEIMGYEVLIGEGNVPVKLKDAKSSRIGKAYLKTYNTARRAIDKYNKR